LKLRVLFLCATNGLHSPMAEALLGRMDSQHFEAVSAGTSCGRVQLRAFRIVRDQIAQRLRLFVIVHVRQRTLAPGTTFSKAARAPTRLFV